jgi:hypothetical protein
MQRCTNQSYKNLFSKKHPLKNSSGNFNINRMLLGCTLTLYQRKDFFMKNPSTTSYNSRTIVFGNQNAGHHYWIGLLSNGNDYFAGQTFKAPANGKLKTIRIYPEMILGNTDAKITVYTFNQEQRASKDKLAEASIKIDASNANSWVSFDNLNIPLKKDMTYIFKLSCNHGNMIAIAECGWGKDNYSHNGEQWTGNSENKAGHFHPGFGLTFLAVMENN